MYRLEYKLMKIDRARKLNDGIKCSIKILSKIVRRKAKD